MKLQSKCRANTDRLASAAARPRLSISMEELIRPTALSFITKPPLTITRILRPGMAPSPSTSPRRPPRLWVTRISKKFVRLAASFSISPARHREPGHSRFATARSTCLSPLAMSIASDGDKLKRLDGSSNSPAIPRSLRLTESWSVVRSCFATPVG